MELRSYQSLASINVRREWDDVTSTLVVMPTGCHDPNQLLLRHDGQLIRAQDVALGDALMGPDGNPRHVTATHSGVSSMVRVIPVKGDPFVVTRDHLLTVVRTNEQESHSKLNGLVSDVPAGDWFGWNNYYKHIHKLFRTGVDFGRKSPVDFDAFHPHPYLVGAILGDGSLGAHLGLTSADQEVVSAVDSYLNPHGLKLQKTSSTGSGAASQYTFNCITRGSRIFKPIMREWLDYLGINKLACDQKHIPDDYKLGPRNMRLEVLAGLMDTDGHLNRYGYDFISKSPRLASDVAFVARSLGLAAYINPCQKFCQTGGGGTYYRVSISGDCSCIPCRIPRKRAPVRRQKKNHLRTGFRVEPAGIGDYAGVSVDGDRRYLMGDFTVTHNCGKTILFADVIHKCQPRRALVIAHREELIFQAKNKIEAYSGLQCGIEMADYRVQETLFGKCPVVVSSIQTQTSGGDGGGRMGKFDPADFGLLIIDEAHHAVSPSYQRMINYYRTNPDLKVLGVTATPDRADEEALGKVFESVAYDYEICNAIDDGWLVPIEQQLIHVADLDFSRIRTTAGDLNGADLAAVMEQEKNLHGVAAPSVEIIGNRRSLVFAASVKQAETLCEIFNRHKPGMAAWVCGETPKDERRLTLGRFASGDIQIVVNCAVLTEGFDDPGVEVIVMARPTKSRSLYSQMVGRSTRPLPGIVDGVDSAEERRDAIAKSKKPSCLVVDFTGNAGKHKLMTSADILGGNYEDEVVERAVRRADKEGKPVRMTELLEEEEEKLAQERERKRLAEEARRAKLIVSATWSAQRISPFDVFGLQPAKSRGWDNSRQLSQKQKDLLLKQGIATDGMPYSQAKQLLNEMFRRWDQKLCSFKQSKWLKSHGYATDMPREKASAIMDAWAKNGWRRPQEVPA